MICYRYANLYISLVISICLGYWNIFMLCPVLCYLLNMQENNMYCLYLFETQRYAHHAKFWNRFPKFCQPEVRGLFMWKYGGLLKFMSFSVWDFDSLCSSILMSFFDLTHDWLQWIGARHMTDKSSSPTLLQLCRSLSPESSSVCCHLRLIAVILHQVVRLSFNHLM